jgi:hypothetical protein
VIVTFCIFRAIDVLLYFGSTTHSQKLTGIILISALWSTALLAGIWMRINWARCVLIAMQLLDIGFTVIAMTNVRISRHTYDILWLVCTALAARVVVIGILVASKDIQRLCSRRDG